MSRSYIQTEINAKDLQAVGKVLETFEEKVRKEIVLQAMMHGAEIHLRATQQLVPKRTGQLHRSLMVEKLGKKGNSVGGAWVFAKRSKATKGGYYAHLVERGHKIFLIMRNKRRVYIGFWPGRPFMRPALENNLPQIISQINRSAVIGALEAAGRLSKK